MSVRRRFGMFAAASVAALGVEAAWAVLRPAPRFGELDPSGRLGGRQLPSLRVVALGDSTLTGIGLDHADQIWVRLLAARLANSFSVELHSFAVGGSKASDILASQLEPAVELAPGLALVSVGANDMLRGVPIPRFEQELDEIAGRLSQVAQLVLLSGVGDLGTIPRLLPPLRHYMTRRSRAGDAAHARVAGRRGVVHAQQWGWSRDRFRQPEAFAADLFHASADGHEVWAEVAWQALEPHLERLQQQGDMPTT